jgi:hypothetical protein
MLTERDQQVATLPKLLFVAKLKSGLADTAKIKVAWRGAPFEVYDAYDSGSRKSANFQRSGTLKALKSHATIINSLVSPFLI